MTSTFHSIETARRSLFTQTAALNTTGHNIANANTEGYTRQRVNMKAAIPIEAYGLNNSTLPGQMGTGVEFSSIDRIREMFLDDQYRGENAASGNWLIQSDTLDKLEAIVNEPSDTGIRTVLDNFWKSWSDLSKNPEDPTARKIVVQTAQSLTDAMNYMSTQLNNLDRDLNSNIDVKGKEIQSYLSSIADLNQSIFKIEGMGDQANDLRDQRDLLTDKLSKIINITVLDTDAGYTISLGGQPLVQGAAVGAVVDNAFLNNAYASGDLKAGEAYGMLFSSNTYVADYKKQLDDMANTIANGEVQVTIPSGSTLPAGITVLKDSEIINPDGTKTTLLAGATVPIPLTGDLKTTVKGLNGLHQLGYALDGSSGRDFFTASIAGEPITAANLRLNPVIAADPTLFATSLRATTDSDGKVTVIKGNNALALLFSNMKDNNTFTTANGTTTGTVGSYLSSMVGQLGIQSQEAARQASNSDYLVDQVNSRRQSVSGVSLDEEMSNMLVFQHAYSAAARFMTTYDEMLDKLINSTGTVGR
ncbi:flagellar hook protein FlgK [Paenibacillus sp. FSL R7-0273]|uniref:flagellar hook-associated protein FlgK n=1 Tax=Paenibacillus sp. FSL R7-0273 TaxID=1536772 RepID=UPI0004F5BBD8|nr:flagellar hook-associated protein FlgK [Paenibacillus sp. FSL R7-0273]AIQ49713.1 flagellar hook protein FlgK [Paenibacillus sp. FSL R7-0273]OMF90229.1 flagellar hook-associated protein FlgK [Paenibacillus sp. FSL R7-0273]